MPLLPKKQNTSNAFDKISPLYKKIKLKKKLGREMSFLK